MNEKVVGSRGKITSAYNFLSVQQIYAGMSWMRWLVGLIVVQGLQLETPKRQFWAVVFGGASALTRVLIRLDPACTKLRSHFDKTWKGVAV